jgi:superfamily II DNA or RNA helicase
VATLHGKRLQNLAGDFQPDLIVCDEAHHAWP